MSVIIGIVFGFIASLLVGVVRQLALLSILNCLTGCLCCIPVRAGVTLGVCLVGEARESSA